MLLAEGVTFKVLPLRMDAAVVAKLDEGVASRTGRSSSALGHYLKELGPRTRRARICRGPELQRGCSASGPPPHRAIATEQNQAVSSSPAEADACRIAA